MKMTREGAQAKVIVDGNISNPFVIGRGVRQGDGLSAASFNLVLHKALETLEQNNTFLNRFTQICGYADDILVINDFGGLGVACWPLVPKFAGSNPAEAVGFLGRKNP